VSFAELSRRAGRPPRHGVLLGFIKVKRACLRAALKAVSTVRVRPYLRINEQASIPQSSKSRARVSFARGMGCKIFNL